MTVESGNEAPRGMGDESAVRIEPRCRVCRDDAVRLRVNTMLARGASYASIVRTLHSGEDDGSPAIGVESVRRHADRHFPLQDFARATYREVLESRAREVGIDFAEGLGQALTPIAHLESLMLRSYQSIVSGEAVVDPATGMRAAIELEKLLQQRSNQPDVAELRAQVDDIIEAVRSTVPQSMWAEIVKHMDGAETRRSARPSGR